jgi:hypothetical protein
LGGRTTTYQKTGTISPVLTSHCQSCWWIIDTGGSIALSFSAFSLENTYDYVKVFAGSTTSATSLGSFTSTTNPGTLTSSTGSMLVWFITDASQVSTALTFSWVSPAGTSAPTFPSMSCANSGSTSTVVQGSLREVTGDYGNSQACWWIINSPTTQPIYWTFTSFSMENQATCSFDSVTIYDGTSTSGTLLGTWCGTASTQAKYPTLNRVAAKATSGNMYVRFVTDHSVTKGGFTGDWIASTPNTPTGAPLSGTAVPTATPTYAVAGTCASSGGVYTAVEGSVSHGTGNYANSATCTWTITTGNPAIYLTFAEFAVEYASGCTSDALKVYDGTSVSAPLLATFCGTSSASFEYPGIGKECAKATSGSMFIRFTSNAANVDTGFAATWDSPTPSPSPTSSPTPAPTFVPTAFPL